MPIISFNYVLNTIVSNEAFRILRSDPFTVHDEPDSICLNIEEDGKTTYQNIDYSQYEFEGEDNFTYINWGVRDIETKMMEQAYQLGGEINYFEEVDKWGILDYEFRPEHVTTRKTLGLLRIFERVNFHGFDGEGNELEPYKQFIWKKINTKKFKTFVGKYRFKQLKVKYS